MPSGVYRPRRPAATVLHRSVREHLETYLAQAGRGDEFECGVPRHVQIAFHEHLRCGILAHGFARAYCHGCGYDFLVAFSWERSGGRRRGRGGWCRRSWSAPRAGMAAPAGQWRIVWIGPDRS